MSEKHHADYTNFNATDRSEALQLLIDSYEALAMDQRNWVCNLANAASLLWHAYKSLNVNVNWTGFYIRNGEKEQLLLGPFQGKVACQTIDFGRGVCGIAASSQETQLVPDVDKFPGHIACDGETKSEIVVPIVSQSGKTLGVIDLDCLDFEGFTDVDKEYLEKLALAITKSCDF
ncbi:uncharacterized protein GVI51_F05731 [Nakaseomyces glabratus]|uniref:GAF domain-containing protein n=2 Tax=Candida glabrata TaxID=5478 RepID=Q6FU58_CANGA|nr:uncharacterized protein CAGL0F06127g [Nakaseomyces glabratus]KAH7587726.1 Uncharacterized protein family UPF0067 signature [Nakaseomyces glabratus]KAH7604209.1 Uncharacterized protein family UPF0067 signature [Nakaseomyces glabratus]KAH7605195.1 Uncharacterized protein family UPF0067 signature [Nakaseomyces glabratus]KAH7607125.1 Uncharacterized protein family UPF0067 signature [Nakaseomyces glabratus]KAH7614202.1 Uncharacterized protein family UPF0067 signature [Nakaseomyces glabratus]|eukprot:XP_446236.1 uncharacterized protein CAGL0F06127g [[Candida] glabrata]